MKNSMRNKLLVLNLLLLCFYSAIYAAEAQTKKYNQGIYTSWKQLNNNSPKFSLDLSKVTYKKVRTTNIIESQIHKLAALGFSKEENTKIGKVLAFSNGEELFFNRKFTALKFNPYFTRVELHGANFGITDELFAVDVNKDLGIGNFPAFCKTKGLDVIDFKNQKVTPIITKKDLKSFIFLDKELSLKFTEEEEYSKDLLKLYAIEYIIRSNS